MSSFQIKKTKTQRIKKHWVFYGVAPDFVNASPMFNQSYSFLTKTNTTLAMMQVGSRSGVYIFSQSRGVYWTAELLPQRMRERRETSGLEESSQRWTITILAAYLLNLYISSTSISPQPLFLLNLYISSISPHRPKVSLFSPLKAEGLSAISASHTYHLRGSINSAALREKFDNQG